MPSENDFARIRAEMLMQQAESPSYDDGASLLMRDPAMMEVGLFGRRPPKPMEPPVNLSRRGIIGLGQAAPENLPAVRPADIPLPQSSPLPAPLSTPGAMQPAPAPARPPVQQPTPPHTPTPLEALAQKAINTPMSRREVLQRARQAAVNQMLPTPKIADVVPEIAAPLAPLTQMAKAAEAVQSAFTPNPAIDNVLRSALINVFEDAIGSEPFAAATSAYSFMRAALEDRVDKKELSKYDKINKRLKRYYDEDNYGDSAYDAAEKIEQFVKDKMHLLNPSEIRDVHSNFMQDENTQLILQNSTRYDPDLGKVVPDNARTKDLQHYTNELTPDELEQYLDAHWNAEGRAAYQKAHPNWSPKDND